MKKILFVVSIIISLILVTPSYCQEIMDCNAYNTYMGKSINVMRLINPNITKYIHGVSFGNEYLLDQYEDDDITIKLIAKTNKEEIIQTITIEIYDLKNQTLAEDNNLYSFPKYYPLTDSVYKKSSLEMQLLGIDVATIKNVIEGYQNLQITTSDDIICKGYYYFEFDIGEDDYPIYALTCAPIAETALTQAKLTNIEYSDDLVKAYFTIENIGKTEANVSAFLDFIPLNKYDERIKRTCSLTANSPSDINPGESTSAVCSMYAADLPKKIYYEHDFDIFTFTIE